MSCIVLVGGGIGCGKTTLVNHLNRNKTELFGFNFCDGSDVCFRKETCTDVTDTLCAKFFAVHFDKLCSIEEQGKLIKTLRGWRNFRADLLMAAERFITLICGSENSIVGPLTQRSQKLLDKISSINNVCTNNVSNAIILVEDNFYYRSMRYDWLQIARRTNLGFATVFVHCPLSTAVYRNSVRGYQIPEEKIKKMLSFLEFPDPEKIKWEKYSIVFDSSSDLTNSALTHVVDMIKEALKNPVEQVIFAEKIEAQKICSKSVIHQADKILRRIVSKKISSFKDDCTDDDDLKTAVSMLVNIRQRLLCDIKQGTVNLPQDVVEKIQNLDVESVLDIFEESLSEQFNVILEEKAPEINVNLDSLKISEN